MNIKHHSQPHMLEKYSFLWSEARLIIAAAALFMGQPVLVAIFGYEAFTGILGLLLSLSWILSGVVSGYLLYRWFKNGQLVFGGKSTKDVVAFFVSVVSGLNLGLTGLTDSNPGMSILSGQGIFFVVALVYLVTAFYLWQRWKASGEKIVG